MIPKKMQHQKRCATSSPLCPYLCLMLAKNSVSLFFLLQQLLLLLLLFVLPTAVCVLFVEVGIEVGLFFSYLFFQFVWLQFECLRFQLLVLLLSFAREQELLVLLSNCPIN